MPRVAEDSDGNGNLSPESSDNPQEIMSNWQTKHKVIDEITPIQREDVFDYDLCELYDVNDGVPCVEIDLRCREVLQDSDTEENETDKESEPTNSQLLNGNSGQDEIVENFPELSDLENNNTHLSNPYVSFYQLIMHGVIDVDQLDRAAVFSAEDLLTTESDASLQAESVQHLSVNSLSDNAQEVPGLDPDDVVPGDYTTPEDNDDEEAHPSSQFQDSQQSDVSRNLNSCSVGDQVVPNFDLEE